MLSVVETGLKLPPSTSQVLREWFEKNRARIRRAGALRLSRKRYSRASASEAAVRAFAETLHKGAPGELNAGLRVFKGRPHANIVQSYGEEFAKALEESRRAVARPPTREGWRAVHVEAVTPREARRLRDAARRGAAGLDRRHDGGAANRRGARARHEIHREVRASQMRFCLAAGTGARDRGAGAHEMSMAEMQVRQISHSEFLWQWTASGARPASDELRPAWPEGCSAEASVLRCGEAGLRGTMAIEGVGKRYSAAMVKVSGSTARCGSIR